MERFKVGMLYDKDTIISCSEEYSEEEDKVLFEYGRNYVGEGFMVLVNPHIDHCVSFMLHDVTGHGILMRFIYKCIYSDFEE